MSEPFEMSIVDLYARAIVTERLVCTVIAKYFVGTSEHEVRTALGPLIEQARTAQIDGASPESVEAIRARMVLAANRALDRIVDMATTVTSETPTG